jgi:hypothetical protein
MAHHRAVTMTLSHLRDAEVGVALAEGHDAFCTITIESEGAAVVLLDDPAVVRQVLLNALARLDAAFPAS